MAASTGRVESTQGLSEHPEELSRSGGAARTDEGNIGAGGDATPTHITPTSPEWPGDHFSRMHGRFSQFTGVIRETIGGMVGNEQMREQGVVQQRQGAQEVQLAQHEGEAMENIGHTKDPLIMQHLPSKAQPSALHRTHREDERDNQRATRDPLDDAPAPPPPQ